MTAAFFRDYVIDLKARIDDLHADTDSYQTYELTMELLAKKMLVSYSMKKAKGQADSLFYRRDTTSGEGRQMEQQTAYGVFSGFFGLGEFLAFTGKTEGLDEKQFAEMLTANWEYPVCAVHFAYRRKGQTKAMSTRMHFVGLNGEGDASVYMQKLARPGVIVEQRPFSSNLLWEWK
ncbi:hypothetical protein QTL95_02860 [Rhizobium sp. S152]|uniref:hypothetical protein n=1 Tax=Rhizobium sp. S152 TaxID=3055038 RepID=UPI0025A9977C|nr:hypothetical protein [Rhizobium sp. S152]MDM9624821.1 hypothetical protein [Rhizobium sp. S152]